MLTLNGLKSSKVLIGLLIVLLICLLAAFAVVMVTVKPVWAFTLFGISDKFRILNFLGVAMGGILLAIQAVMSCRRAKAMEDAANAQADAARAQAGATAEQAKANQNAEKGLRQERLRIAIEHLGHNSDSVRLGGAYELFHLAQDTKGLRQTVLDILCAYIRRTTSEDEYREQHKSKPSEEIQSLLTLLFVQEHEIFKGLHINLQGSWLNGADLWEAHLAEANLAGAHMRTTYLGDSYLQGSNLSGAQMQAIDLRRSCLQSSTMARTQMQCAYLLGTRMQCAYLSETQMQGAYLYRTEMQGTLFAKVQMQGAGNSVWDIDMPFPERIKEAIGKETDFSEVILRGGLSQENVDFLAKGLSDVRKDCPDAGISYCGDAQMLREMLKPDIDKPTDCKPWEGMGVYTGSYTKEEAEEWIALHERAS